MKFAYLIHRSDVGFIPALLLDGNTPCRGVDHSFMILFDLSHLLHSQFLFDLSLVAIPSIKQLTSFFCRNVCELLRTLLLVSQTLDTVLQRLVLHHLVLEDLLLLAHLVPHHDAVLWHLGMAALTKRVTTRHSTHQTLLLHRRTH